jgi:hypothetical protein
MQPATDEAEFNNAIEALEATAASAGIYGRTKVCDY